MPMQSQAQRRFLWAKHPDVARKFEDETPKGKKLPKHKKGKGSSNAYRKLQKKSSERG